MGEHTPEPWKANVEDDLSFGMLTAKDADGKFGYIAYFPKSSDAARAAACVNACKGLNPEAVPDLLAACRTLLSLLDEETTAPLGAVLVARAAIAKATGKE